MDHLIVYHHILTSKNLELCEPTLEDDWNELTPRMIFDYSEIYIPELKSKKRAFKFKSPNWNF